MPATLSRVLAERDITTPTPIQSATLADAIGGRDVLGRGRTGSGKTYAFLLPLVTRLSSPPRRSQPTRPRAVILAPTRELVLQIDTALQPLAAAAGLTSRTVFGGVSQQPQVRALRTGVDILVACPGRLEDLVKQGMCRLDGVQITVLDEADHMADLGFLPGVTRLLALTPRDGQRLFFSATLDSGVDVLVKRFLRSPAVHQADSAQAPVSTMDHHVLHVRPDTRTEVLVDLAAAPGRTLIFTRTKYRAKTLTRQLNARGVHATELHGNLSQNARTRSMDAFHTGQVRTLVATDIAARGIHVDDIELVVHADPPTEHKAYVHRSGRTARAGKQGVVVTLMTDDQVRDVRALTRAAGIKPTTTVVDSTDHPVLRELASGERRFETVVAAPASAPGGGRSGRRPKANASRRGGSQRGPRAKGPGTGTGTGGRTNSARASATSSGSGHSASNFSRRVRNR
ncbi:MAG: DEAD/DEAH box helicase [Microlunatus sp.]|nr:DEAD/DEAH box helicase [Microlunatus sp.]